MKRLQPAPNLALATLWADMLSGAGVAAPVQRAWAGSIVGELPPDQGLPEIWVQDDSQLELARQLLRDWQPGIMTYSHPLGPTSRWTGGLGGIVWRPDWVWSVVWLGLVISSLYFVARQPPFLYQGF